MSTISKWAQRIRQNNKGVITASYSMAVFDRQLKRRQRTITNLCSDNINYNYLKEESCRRLVDRIEDITKQFPITLEIGSSLGMINQMIVSESLTGVGGIKKFVQCDMINQNHRHSELSSIVDSYSIQCDEEYLPFGRESFDLVLSSMSLHWVNDIPSVLKQVHDILRPDGAFIACMLGGSTLQELKHCFYLAEMERKGGISPHVSPYVLPSDVAGLLQSHNFSLPTVDVDTIKISYPDAFTLMEHIYWMGEGTSSVNRQYSVGRDTMLSAASLYQELYGLEDGGIVATFELIYLIGWKPHNTQPTACKRGSATKSLKDLTKQ